MSIDLGNFSQMQQYYLTKQLPEFATIKDAPKQKKDHYYYNDNFNIWNNRAQTANKNYAFYHQQVDQGKQAIQVMKDKEVVDRLIQEECRKDYIISQKQRDKERLQSRKQERMALQLESMQDIVNKDGKEVNSFIELTSNPSNFHNSMSINNLIYSKSSAKQNQNPLLGRAPYQWNKFNQTSEKFIKQAINPKIIQKDEEAVHMITDRIEQDRQVVALKQESYDKIYQQTRTTFLKQHQRNIEFEKKCGLIPQEKPIVIIQSKINKNSLAPMTKKLTSSSSVKQMNRPAQQQQQQQQQQQNQQGPHESYIEKRNSLTTPMSQFEFIAGDDKNSKQSNNLNGQPSRHSNDGETDLNSARRKLESQQKSSRKAQSIQIILNQNTNDIHKNLQYSSLPYSDENDQGRGSNIVIQYNNKNNQQSKQQVDQINFGDEKNMKGNKSRRKSSLAKNSDHADAPSSILKANVQSMPINAKSQRVNSSHSVHQNAQNVGLKNEKNQLELYATEREFLTSAESHNKKQVNFQSNITASSEIVRNQGESSNIMFAQKNLDDIKQNGSNLKLRRIDELAMPKTEFHPKEFLERSEYKGLLTTELDNVNVNSDTEFARTMMLNSQIVNSHIYNSQRPSTRQSKISRITQTNQNTFSFVRPSTTASGTRSVIYKNPQNISSTNLEMVDFFPPPVPSHPSSCSNNSTINRIYSTKNVHRMNAESTLNIDLKNELLSEIDTFEKKYQFVKENRVGFSKSNLMKFQQKETFMSAKSALGQK